MRLRPKALMWMRAWQGFGVGLGIEGLMYIAEAGMGDPLMVRGFMSGLVVSLGGYGTTGWRMTDRLLSWLPFWWCCLLGLTWLVDGLMVGWRVGFMLELVSMIECEFS